MESSLRLKSGGFKAMGELHAFNVRSPTSTGRHSDHTHRIRSERAVSTALSLPRPNNASERGFSSCSLLKAENLRGEAGAGDASIYACRESQVINEVLLAS